jgi:FixJ family two-component response regulator
MIARSLVTVIDDDQSMRESLPDLLQVLGFAACVFSSAQDFLSSERINDTECLILDVSMPGMSGPQLLDELKLRQSKIPVIFITAQRDEAIRARLIQQGAVECLFKPFSDTALQSALDAALRT